MPSDKNNKISNTALLFFFIINFFYAFKSSFFYTRWTDRDLTRGLEAFKYFEPMGAELSFYNGDRIPGGLMNYIWGITLQIYPSPFAVLFVQTSLFIGSLYFLWKILIKEFGFISTAFFIFFINFGINLYIRGIWNPMMSAPFTIMTFAFIVKSILDNDNKYIKYAFLCCFMAIQMHLSISVLLLSLIVFAIIRKINLKEVGLIVVFFILNYLLYLIYEYQHDFSNTKSLLIQLIGIQIKLYYIIPTLLVCSFFYFIPSKYLLKVISLIFFTTVLVGFTFSFSTYIEKDPTIDLEKIVQNNNIEQCSDIKDIDKKGKIYCHETNLNFDNLNYIHDTAIKSNLTNYLKNQHSTKTQNVFIKTENYWGKKYENLEMLVLNNKNTEKIFIIYTKYGDLKPVFNFENFKTILNFNNSLHFGLIILCIFIVVVKSDDKYSNLLHFLLLDIIFYLLIFSKTFSLSLNEHHNRYLSANFLVVAFFMFLLTQIVIKIIKNRYIDIFNIKRLNILFYFLIFFLMLITVVNETIETYQKNQKWTLSDLEEGIKKISKITGESILETYLKTAQINNKKLVYERVAINFLVNPSNKELFAKKSNYCYVFSESYINLDDIIDIYSYPRTFNMDYFYENNNSYNYPTKNHNYPTFNHVEIKNIELLYEHKIDKYMFNNIYKINFYTPQFCSTSFNNRYSMTSNDKLEQKLYNSKLNRFYNKSSETTNVTVKNFNKNSNFVYTLMFNENNNALSISSNQLKGLTFNSGFFMDYTLINPKFIVDGIEYKIKDNIALGSLGVTQSYTFELDKIDIKKWKNKNIIFSYDLIDRKKYVSLQNYGLIHAEDNIRY